MCVLRKFLEYSEVEREIPTWSEFSVPLSVKGVKKFRGRNEPCGDE
jgi:hypothetical protein